MHARNLSPITRLSRNHCGAVFQTSSRLTLAGLNPLRLVSSENRRQPKPRQTQDYALGRETGVDDGGRAWLGVCYPVY